VYVSHSAYIEVTYVGVLELGDGVGNSFFVDGRSVGAERDALIRNGVAQGVWLEDDSEVKVLRLGDDLGVFVNKLLLVNVCERSRYTISVCLTSISYIYTY
jgi:hypothetical protein